MESDLEKPALALLKPDWKAPENIRAVFTLRNGGVSSGPFGNADGFCGLNVGLYCGDAKVCVRTNRNFVSQFAGGDPKWLHQVHGTKIVHADEAVPEEEADGSWTMTPGVITAVQTADCLPVILTNGAGTIVCALHAGWKGLAAGILQEGVRLVREKAGESPVYAWLAPRIGAESFEVGPEVLDAMKRKLPEAETAFRPSANSGRYMADLAALAVLALCGEGVARENIADCGFSTVTDANNFFSFRRDHGETGRHAALAWIEVPKEA